MARYTRIINCRPCCNLHVYGVVYNSDGIVPGVTVTADRQLDKDEVDQVTPAALAPFLPGLHHPRAVAAGHPERHPLRLAVAQALSLAATAQLGTHRRRLALGAHVDALGHVRRPRRPAARVGAHPARRTHFGQRVHRTVATHTHTTRHTASKSMY